MLTKHQGWKTAKHNNAVAKTKLKHTPIAPTKTTPYPEIPLEASIARIGQKAKEEAIHPGGQLRCSEVSNRSNLHQKSPLEGSDAR
jgi:hypothetical protein